jgi:hypothetical protein
VTAAELQVHCARALVANPCCLEHQADALEYIWEVQCQMYGSQRALSN